MSKFLDYNGLVYFWSKIKEQLVLPGLETDESIFTLFDTEMNEPENRVDFGTNCANEANTILTIEGAVVNDTLIIS